MYQLRRDGFASLRASDISKEHNDRAPARIRTHLLSYSGSHLFVHAAVKAGGWLRIIAISADGLTRVLSKTIRDIDTTSYQVEWIGRDALFLGPAQFEFILRGTAELFSFWVAVDSSGDTVGGVLPPCAPGLEGHSPRNSSGK